MRKTKRILVLSGIFFAIAVILNFNKLYAASATITGSQTVTQGSSVTVTGSVNAGAWNMKLVGAGQTKGLAGQTDTTGNKGASTSITFTASTIGSYTFTFSGDITDYNTDATTYPSQTCTITVVAASSSGNNGGGIINNGNSSSGGNNTTNNTNQSGPKITSLGITPLEYDFNNFKVGAPTGSTYYAKVPNEVTSISIYANGATSGTGTKTLKEGTNKFTVSNGTYTYYINVTRATLDGEEPANKPDDEERDEDIDTVIGLKSLSIEGYEFDKEFKSDVFEYKVKVEEALTQIQLDQIKELVKAEVNAENVEYEVVAELAEDGVATITIIVKDAEKEYSKYVITFEVEEEESEEIIGAVLPMPNKSNPTRGMFGLTEEQQIYAILGVFGITFLIALIYAVVSYVQHRKLLEYTEEDEEDNFEDYYGEDEEAPSVIEQLYKDRNSDSMAAELQEEDIPKSLRKYSSAKVEESAENVGKIDDTVSNVSEISDKDESDSVIDRSIDYERKLFNARSLKNGRRAGKH